MSVTRFNVLSRAEELDFDVARFSEIAPGASHAQERAGFVPFEPVAPYQVGEHRWAFKVRIDRLKPDPTAVREKFVELLVAEREATGSSYVGARRRKRLRLQAVEEMVVKATPRSSVIECCLDGMVLYVGTTANTSLGMVLALLRQVGVVCDFKTPWLDSDEPQAHSEIVEVKEAWQSVLGCRFLNALLEDSEVLYEPERGGVRLQTRDAMVSLSGAVMNDLLRFIEAGAQVLSAKLVTAEAAFRLDGLSFRLTSLRVETEPLDSWIEVLDARLEQMSLIWDLLDAKFLALAEQLRKV